jgi:predicted RNase H-like HicB family nuclease
VNARQRQRSRPKQGRRERAPGDRVKTVDDYLKLPYQLTVVRDDERGDAGWVARVDEIPGCTTRARTAQEAVSEVTQLLTSWIAEAIEEGREVPEPKSPEGFSGRLLVRMPQTLHGELTRSAEREQVSLNQFITDVLAGAVGWRAPGAPARPVVKQLDGGALDELDEDHVSGEDAGPSRPRWGRSSRFATVALVANFVFVAAAATAAILVLIAALK